ncbi:RHS repeat domain-containing protein [Lutimonas vermicola]|uniref:RHS repeat domain-containing protein n=1 Tax=Lutimonas vermicola TaxID=414288 RepID=A0ABU9L3E8_9FLAO
MTNIKLFRNLLLIILLSNCAKDKIGDCDLNHLSLRGDVKSIRCDFYEAKEKGGKIFKGYKKESGKTLLIMYDNIGFITKTIYDKQQYRGPYEELIKYDNNCNEIEKIINEEGQFVLKRTYKYDDNGVLIGETHFKEDGSSKYIDFEKGNFKYEYDNEGNLIRATRTEKDYFTYEYDNEGRLIKTTEFSSYVPNDENIQLLKYSDEGYLISKKYKGRSTDNGEKYDYTESFTYEFDKKGNIIKKIEYLDGVPIIIEERKIEYD